MIIGINRGLAFHTIHEMKDSNLNSHIIEPKASFIIEEHTDIVKCIKVVDSRIYSAGYDGALVFYDCPYSGKESAVCVFKNRHAHNAGISCMHIERDTMENNIWVITGSFDKCVKVWTNDGKIVHKIGGFITSVTGICFLPKNKTICCFAGTNGGTIIDLKSGEDVSNYIDTFNDDFQENYYLHLLKYVNEVLFKTFLYFDYYFKL
jgi:WD40 repeat protein